MMRRSFWEDALYTQKRELVVIGAGITGLSVAFFYKKHKPEAQITILERGEFPTGASTRNAGFACIGTVGEHLADLEIETEAIVKARIKERYEGLLLLRKIAGDVAIEYDDCGGWEVFTDHEKFENAAQHISRFNGWLESLIGEKNVYKAGKVHGYPAIFNRLEGGLHPGKMIRRLIDLNSSVGNEIRWGAKVEQLDIRQGVVETKNGWRIEADTVVLATNAFTSTLSGGNEINPGRGLVLLTKPVDDLAWKGTFHFDQGYVYFRNVGEHRLLIGGGRNRDVETETTTQFGINQSIKTYLLDFMHHTLALPQSVEIDREWSGIMGFTSTKSATEDWLSDRTFQVAGLSGMGVALGMALGKKAAEQLRRKN